MGRGRTPAVTPEDEGTMVQMMCKGCSIEEISKATGYPEGICKKYIKLNRDVWVSEMPIGQRFRGITFEDKQKIYRMHENGLMPVEISKKTSVHVRTVRRIIEAMERVKKGEEDGRCETAAS